MTSVTLGFVPEPLAVPLPSILPSRRTPAGITSTRKFKQICSSIQEVGLIEPLSVTAADQQSGNHTLLDGHIRLLALHDLGHDEAACLVATDDEAYTYNNRINRLSTIQEHLMIRRAVERGVSPERLAKALSVDITQIMKKMNLLEGICPEAVDLLRDRQFSPEVARAIRKMRPTRHVTVAYAEALLVATPASRLIEGRKPAKLIGVTQEQMGKMEREMSNLQEQYKIVEQTYGQDVLNLVLAKGYLVRLLECEPVLAYLRQHQPDLACEFESIRDVVSLEQ